MSPKWSPSTKYIVLALVLAAVIATVQFARPVDRSAGDLGTFGFCPRSVGG
jgi:hypothetical protein